MIREATISDIPRMIELGEQMHHESPRFSQLTWNADKVEKLIRYLIEDADGLALVAIVEDELVGGFLGMAFDHWCTDARTSTDFALFVTPAHRGGSTGARLLRRYAAWAKSRGVADGLLNCGITTGVDLASSTALYKVCGFEHAGHLFVFKGR